MQRNIERIVSIPDVCDGEPCVRGTRIQVQIVLSHLATGDTYEMLLQHFPRLTQEDIQACLSYAEFHKRDSTYH